MFEGKKFVHLAHASNPTAHPTKFKVCDDGRLWCTHGDWYATPTMSNINSSLILVEILATQTTITMVLVKESDV